MDQIFITIESVTRYPDFTRYEKLSHVQMNLTPTEFMKTYNSVKDLKIKFRNYFYV